MSPVYFVKDVSGSYHTRVVHKQGGDMQATFLSLLAERLGRTLTNFEVDDTKN